jgi:hypothetical protein
VLKQVRGWSSRFATTGFVRVAVWPSLALSSFGQMLAELIDPAANRHLAAHK